MKIRHHYFSLPASLKLFVLLSITVNLFLVYSWFGTNKNLTIESIKQTFDSADERLITLISKHLHFKPFLGAATSLCPVASMCAYDAPMIERDLKLLFCWIPKNSCSQMKALFCRHHGSLGRDYKLDDVHKCGFPRATLPKDDNIWTDSAWRHLAIVRHPFLRFASGYLNKVTMEGKGDNCDKGDLGCFVDRLHHRTSLFHSSPELMQSTFKQYKYSDHFAPQFWSCDFQRYLGYYKLVKMESENFQDDLIAYLKDVGWPPEQLDAGWGPGKNEHFLTGTTSHATTSKDHQEIESQFRKSSYLTEIHLRTYLIDYVVFNYTFPEWTVGQCQKCGEKCADWLICLVSQTDVIEKVFSSLTQIMSQRNS